jgi:hypothetical protein
VFHRHIGAELLSTGSGGFSGSSTMPATASGGFGSRVRGLGSKALLNQCLARRHISVVLINRGQVAVRCQHWGSVANKPSIGLIKPRLIDWIVN